MKSNVINEVKQVYGVIPRTLKEREALTDTLAPSWQMIRTLTIDNGAIPQEYRCLIGVAVASAMRLEHVLALHMTLSEKGKPTDRELNEAAFLAQHTVAWSTYLHTRLFPLDVFGRDVERIMEHMRSLGGKIPATSPEQTPLEQITTIFGFVPEFLRDASGMPEAFEAAWQLMKTYTHRQTHIPAKYRELIGVAVAGAIHCPYCSFFHRESALLHGATEEELRETAWLAQMNASWGVYSFGRSIDPKQIRDEARQMLDHMMAGSRR